MVTASSELEAMGVLAEDVEALRRVVGQQQQALEGLRHEQGLLGASGQRHQTALTELEVARPALDAWVAGADAGLRSAAAQVAALHGRCEALAVALHERPGRAEGGPRPGDHFRRGPAGATDGPLCALGPRAEAIVHCLVLQISISSP